MTIRILQGDCREVMATLPETSVDAIVCDPPYGLTAGKKGGTGEASLNPNSPAGRARIGTGGGFMGQKWDGSGVENDPATWAAALRVLKPGGHLLAFSGTRTYHRMVCAIEDAGFEIRDQIGWLYAAGFPKSLNLDRERGGLICGCESPTERDVRPMHEADVSTADDAGRERRQVLQPSVPQSGAPAHRQAGIFSGSDGGEEPCVEGRRDPATPARELRAGPLRAGAGVGATDGKGGRVRDGAPAGDGRVVRLPVDEDGGCASRGPRPAAQPAAEPIALAGQPQPQAGGAWPVCGGCGKPILPRGLGTALKPAWEPVCVARKPLHGTVIQTVLAHGTGALNIDGCRVEGVKDTPASPRRAAQGAAYGELGNDPGTGSGWDKNVGRWPANVILSYPEDEYELRTDVTPEQKRELFGWLHANA